ncbi:hypothetical protein XENOCAPTIV_009391 [Xenoophorus captivus]|uniref:Uncharacterized protein n=1 Tax=Xenoophorus captivus TaxID=1517983 RepID=A0ABV0QW22_9TELE
MGYLLIHCPLLLGTICMLGCPAVSGLFEWVRITQPPPATAPPPPVAPALLAKDAPFEMVTIDEKFLAEAKQLELSPLDSCHYRVIGSFLHCSFQKRLFFSCFLYVIYNFERNEVSTKITDE